MQTKKNVNGTVLSRGRCWGSMNSRIVNQQGPAKDRQGRQLESWQPASTKCSFSCCVKVARESFSPSSHLIHKIPSHGLTEVKLCTPGHRGRTPSEVYDSEVNRASPTHCRNSACLQKPEEVAPWSITPSGQVNVERYLKSTKLHTWRPGYGCRWVWRKEGF